MPFKLDGTRAMADRLRRLAVDFPREINQAVTVDAEETMTISKRDHVPVDLGPLRASGKVLPAERKGRDVRVVLQFGDNAAPYALTVHEHPSRHDPPSWRGVQVTFSPSGRGPKYLEIPLMERTRGMRERIARRLKL